MKFLLSPCADLHILAAGEERKFSRWKNTLAHMDKGRYAGDTVLDYLQNKDTKALVFTDKHLVYLNLKRQRLRWAFPVLDLTTVTTHGQQCASPTVLVSAALVEISCPTAQVAAYTVLSMLTCCAPNPCLFLHVVLV